MTPTRPSRLRQNAVAVAAILVAVAVKEILGPEIVPSVYITFYGAVLVSAIQGGFWPGVFTLVLSAGLGWALYLVPQSPQAGFDLTSLARVASFAVVSFGICWFVDRSRLSRIQIAESEARLRRLVDSDMIGVLFWDRYGGIEDANDEFLRMIGYTRDDLAAGWVRWDALTPPEYVHLDVAGLAQIDATGICAPFEKEYIRKDGGRVPVVLGGAVFDDDRRRGVSFVLDVTERKRADDALRQAKSDLEERVAERTAELRRTNERLEAELRERLRVEAHLRQSEERYALAAAGANDGVWDWDVQANTAYLSARWKEMVGLAPDEIGNDPDEWVRRVHSDDRDLVASQLAAHLDGATPHFRCEYRLLHADGGYRWVLSRGIAVRDDAGNPYRMAGSLTDVTARRRAEEEVRRRDAELAHAQRLSTLGEMAASIAHELNQPLTAIANYASGCQRRIASGDTSSSDLVHAIEQISKQALRAGDILKRYRGFVRTGADRFDWLDLNAMAQEVARFAAAAADEVGVGIRLDLCSRVPPVLADAVQIEQVLVNLIRNGLDAMKDAASRELWIRTRARDGQVEVAVEDAGQGVPETLREQVFDAFFTTKPEGLGMGLSISCSIVAAHGGQIRLASNGSAGATFTFTLPVEPPADILASVRAASKCG